MRNAQKTAVMALFAAMETAKDEAQRGHTPLRFPAEPPAGRAIQLDPLWLVSRGAKGRA